MTSNEQKQPQDIPVKNNTNVPIYVGSAMIPPGETLHFPEHQVQQHLRPARPQPEPQTATDPVLDLLDGNVDSVIAAVRNGIDGKPVSDEALARLIQAEENGKTRKSLLGPLNEIVMERAAGGGDDLPALEDFTQIVAILDVGNEEHWTTDGKPEVAALAAAGLEVTADQRDQLWIQANENPPA